MRRAFAELSAEATELAGQVSKHLRLLAAFAVAVQAGVLVFSRSGVYSVAAATRHFPIFR